MLDLGTAVGYLMLDTSGFTSGFSEAQAGVETFRDTTLSAQDRISGLGSAMSAIGGTLTKTVTLPLIGVGAAAMKVGNDFEAQMSRVQAISGATGDELSQLNDLALQLGADTSFSASQAAEGMENLASAGFTVTEIMDAMPGLLDLAASSGAELGQSTEIAAAAIRGFGLDASEAGHVADVFAEASARTNAQVEDMGEAMKYIAPVANAMGQSLEMTAAAVGIMSDAGIKGSQAGTALRGALSRLAKPTDEMVSTMEDLGISFYDSEGNMLSLVGIVEQLETGMAGLTQEQQNNALITLFGQESLSGMLALMERGPDELASMTKSFEEADGAAKDMADTMLDNTSGSIEAMYGSIETLGIKVQQIMAPAIQNVVEKITEFVNGLSSMDEGTLELILSIASIVAAIGPMLLVFGKLATVISTVVSVVSGAGGIAAALMTLVSPVNIIVAAVAALALAWATDFGGIRDTTTEILEAIGSIFQTWWDFIYGLWNSNFLGIQDTAMQAFAFIETIFSNAFDIIVDIFNVFAALFTGDWDGLWEAVKTLVQDVWNNTTELFWAWLNLLVDTLIRIGVRLWEGAKTAFSNIQKGFTEVWSKIKSWFEKAINDPVGTVKGIGKAMYDAGASIFNMLWDGLTSVWTGIQNWVSDKVDWLLSKVRFWESESDKVSRSSFDGGQSGGGRSIQGSYASGLDYVPRDMTVRVHEGETIYTKQQTGDLLAQLKTLASMPRGSGSTTVVVQIGNRTIRKFVVDAANEETMATGQTVLHV